MDRKLVGVSLIALAVVLFLSTSGSLGITQTFKEALQKDGQVVTCAVTFDQNNVKTAVCSSIDECRTGFPFFLGIGESDTTLRMLVNGRTYDSETFKTTFDFDEQAQLQGCVPGTAQSVTVQVVNENGQVEDSRTVALQ